MFRFYSERVGDLFPSLTVYSIPLIATGRKPKEHFFSLSFAQCFALFFVHFYIRKNRPEPKPEAISARRYYGEVFNLIGDVVAARAELRDQLMQAA